MYRLQYEGSTVLEYDTFSTQLREKKGHRLIGIDKASKPVS